MRTKIFTSGCVVLWVVAVFAQAPGPAPAKPPVATAKIGGRIVAADTGKPLRHANVTLLALPTKVVRIAVTDGDGRYEFTGVQAGRYNLSPNKSGYVVVGANPFDAGMTIEVAAGENADRTDFMMPRGSVITGRITDDFGEPLAGVMVQAARYQFRPSGERQLIMGSSGNFFMPGGTDDRGEYRIFGLRPGSYYVSARTVNMSALAAMGQSGGPGIGALDTNDGLATTFYPGTANVAEAQTIQVGLMHVANASFTLVPARMARVSGTVLDSQGRTVSRASVQLRSVKGITGAWLGGGVGAQLSPDGTFTLANVTPGDYTLEVRPIISAAIPGQQMPAFEYASLPVTVAGEDLELAISTTPGISVSGHVIFEGGSNIAQQDLRIAAAPEEEARNVLSYRGAGGVVSPDGQFRIPSVYGRVVFRTSPLPTTVMLKSVTLNGVDITDTPFDATRSDDITNLRVVVIDQQGRIQGFARNQRGEIQFNYRLVVYPANPKPGDVTIRFQHNTSPSNKGQFGIGRMPPGEYVGLAVKGVQPGEEWDPALRARVEQLGKRFTLKEGETLDIEMPYVE